MFMGIKLKHFFLHLAFGDAIKYIDIYIKYMTEDISEHTLQNSKEQTHKIPMLICISSYCAFLARKTNLPTWHNQFVSILILTHTK